MNYILNEDYEKYKENCRKHNIQPEEFIGWRLRVDEINYRIAELMEELE